MADITISDLELAPALTDDMVLPVENTTDTYAATLAMLRRLINKTFVEVENADFNALTDDGFYQCTGTPTNSPVAGAINWTLQVSAESGVVVQRAFSLDDNFANLYIRRWNGVTWTAWLEVGAGALANKANISLSNLDATGQAKFNAKANTDLSNVTSNIDYVIFSGVKNGIEIIEWKSGKIELFTYVQNVANAESGGTLVPLPYPKDNSKTFCCLSGGVPGTKDNGITSFYCSFVDNSNIKVVRDYYGTSNVASCYTFAWYYRQK